MRVFVLLPLLLLAGCLSPSARTAGVVAQQPEIKINVPPQDTGVRDAVGEESEKTRLEVRTQLKSSQDALSGLVTGKIDEIKDLVKLDVRLENRLTAQAKIDTKLEAVVQAVGKLETTINGNITNTAVMKAQLEAQLSALSNNMVTLKTDLRAEVKGSLEGAQVGLGNKFEKTISDLKANAGRDVNMLPKEAVHLMLGIMGAIQVMVLVIAGYLYKAGRAREEHYAELLMAALRDNKKD